MVDLSKDDVVSKKTYVTEADLPLSCPLPKQEIWNLHPKVYIHLDEDGEAVCPYCGNEFCLIDSE